MDYRHSDNPSPFTGQRTMDNTEIGASSASAGSVDSLVKKLWILIEDYENPGPETAAYIPRENAGATLRTLLFTEGIESRNPPNGEAHEPEEMP